MSVHFGLQILSGVSKTIFEVALEYYASSVIRSKTGYLSSHINEICSNENPNLEDTYANRVQGYKTLEESMAKVLESDTELCKKITALMKSLHKEDDFVVLDAPSTTSEETSPSLSAVDSKQDMPSLTPLTLTHTPKKKTKAQRRRARKAKAKKRTDVDALAARVISNDSLTEEIKKAIDSTEDIVELDVSNCMKQIVTDLADSAVESVETVVDKEIDDEVAKQRRCIIC
jgi:uncharacterized phage infection (PIP) family protein YhgE